MVIKVGMADNPIIIRSEMDARSDVKCGLAALHSRYSFIRYKWSKYSNKFSWSLDPVQGIWHIRVIVNAVYRINIGSESFDFHTHLFQYVGIFLSRIFKNN